ncbi:MAG: hypothetical protein ACRCZO_00920 [Cetobacterium sp.]
MASNSSNFTRAYECTEDNLEWVRFSLRIFVWWMYCILPGSWYPNKENIMRIGIGLLMIIKQILRLVYNRFNLILELWILSFMTRFKFVKGSMGDFQRTMLVIYGFLDCVIEIPQVRIENLMIAFGVLEITTAIMLVSDLVNPIKQLMKGHVKKLETKIIIGKGIMWVMVLTILAIAHKVKKIEMLIILWLGLFEVLFHRQKIERVNDIGLS